MRLTDENISSKKKMEELNQMLENSKLEQKSLQVMFYLEICVNDLCCLKLPFLIQFWRH